jgi:glutamate-1-semialdehyde 2,1-aminomutase
MSQTKFERDLSRQVYEDMCSYIPGGVNSPARAFRGVGLTPLIVSHAKEDIIYDIDGYSYIDFCNSWGALILGHSDDQIIEAVYEQIRRGSSFGVSTEIEGMLAKKIVSLMPHIEKIRFVSSGTEATMSAIRLARGYTGKDYIIKFSGNYHGHSDSLLVRAGSGLFIGKTVSDSLGVPQSVIDNTLSLPYNDIEALEHCFSDNRYKNNIAAVILEPITGNMGVIKAQDAFINSLRRITSENGSLLIFDEVMSGFRVALKGAVEIFNVKPDITCLGKIIGGGYPAAAFGGRKEIMDMLSPLGKVYQAGTLSGNPVAMRAGYETLMRLSRPGFYEELERKCHYLLNPIIEALNKKKSVGCVQRVGGMFTIFFGKDKVDSAEDGAYLNQEIFKEYFRFLLENGIYMPQSQYEASFISMAHTYEHLKYTRDKIMEFLQYVFRNT